MRTRSASSLLIASVSLATWLVLAAGGSSVQRQWFDVTQTSGLAGFVNTQGSAAKDYIVESIGGGCAFIDYNRDQKLDVLLVRGTTLERFRRGGDSVVALYRNRGDGTFVDATEAARLSARGWGMGVVVADYDNDGWPDFVVTGLDRNYLFHNEGDGAFTEISEKAGVIRRGVWCTGAAFADVDRDGLLDLYIAGYVDLDINRLPQRGSGPHCLYKGQEVFCGPRGLPTAPDALFRNNGDGAFADITRQVGITEAASPGYGLGVVAGDFDNDNLTDIFVANDSTPNFLFHNQGGNQFREVGLMAGVAMDAEGRAQASMGVAMADYDNDGWADIFVTNFSEDTNQLYRNLGNGSFADLTWHSRIGPVSWLFLGWGTKFVDYDNDSQLDLIVTNGHVYPEADRFRGGSTYRQRPLVYHNRGKGVFDEVGDRDPVWNRPGTGRGLAVGDYDNDGDMDVLINQADAPPRLIRNDTSNRNYWLRFVLVGKNSNRDGVGVKITLETPRGKQTAERLAGDSYLSSGDPRLHFGVGPAAVIERVTARWPSGRVQTLTDVKAGQTVLLEEPVTAN